MTPESDGRRCSLLTPLLVVVLAGMALFGVETKKGEQLAHQWSRRLEGELKDIQAGLDKDLQTLEAEHRRRMADEEYVSGRTAAKAREAEWTRRNLLEPALAHSAVEKTMLRMMQLGADPNGMPEEILKEVALLAAPRGSAVEVVNGDAGFEVKVAFRMSAMTAGEAGAITKHDTPAAMRREAEDICARVIRDVFASCGRRGISRLQVTCNHAVRQSQLPLYLTDDERRLVLADSPAKMARLYRTVLDSAEAAAIRNWRQAKVTTIIRRFKVDYDGFQHLTIDASYNGRTMPEDPDTPLEF